jgi:hypothetical protein
MFCISLTITREQLTVIESAKVEQIQQNVNMKWKHDKT